MRKKNPRNARKTSEGERIERKMSKIANRALDSLSVRLNTIAFSLSFSYPLSDNETAIVFWRERERKRELDLGKLLGLNRESSRVFNCNCSRCFFGVFEGRMIVLKPTSPGELKEREKEGAIFYCGFLFLVWSGTRRDETRRDDLSL